MSAIIPSMDHLEKLCQQARVESAYYHRDITPLLESKGFLSCHYSDPNFRRSLYLSAIAERSPPADYFKRVKDESMTEFLFLEGIKGSHLPSGTHYFEIPHSESGALVGALDSNQVTMGNMTGLTIGILVSTGAYLGAMKLGISDLSIMGMAKETSEVIWGLLGISGYLGLLGGSAYLGNFVSKKMRSKQIDRVISKSATNHLSAPQEYDFNVLKSIL